MTITLTWQTLITIGSVITAATVIGTLLVKGVSWFLQQKKQTQDIKNLEIHHEEDIKEIEEQHKKDKQEIETQHQKDKREIESKLQEGLASIKHEQTLLTFGLLACLKGLKEQGCNGPVTEAIDKLEKYLNQKAHEDIY